MKLTNLVAPIAAAVGAFAGLKFGVKIDTPGIEAASKNLIDVAKAIDPAGIKELIAKWTAAEAENKKLKEDLERYVALLQDDSKIDPITRHQLRAGQTWKPIDFDIDSPDFEKTLNESHVCPDGVKILWAIGTYPPNAGHAYVFIRQGDNRPITYKLRKIANTGSASVNASDMETRLIERGQVIIPIGWGFENKYYAYLQAQIETKGP